MIPLAPSMASVEVGPPRLIPTVTPAPAIQSSPHPNASTNHSDPNAIPMSQHVAILQQILAPKPATVRMLRFMAQQPDPPFQLEDYIVIRNRFNNDRTKIDNRNAGRQRMVIRIRGRSYYVAMDRSLPPEYRYVLNQQLPSGETVRVAEASGAKAAAWAIPIFEQGIGNMTGWEERLGRIHGASINGVTPGDRRDP